MFHVLLSASLAIHLLALGPPNATTSSAPAAPTSRPANTRVEKLLTQLRSPQFAVREAAQKKLSELGETALPALIPHLSDEDAEVASRVAELVGKPRDPALRIEVSVRLIESTDPDWIERGVHMLFEDPLPICDLFIHRANAAQGQCRELLKPVADQLRRTKTRHENFQSRYPKWLKENPEGAAKLLIMNRESDLYDAEAAYWAVREVMGEREDRPDGRSPTSAPTRLREEHPTSEPARKRP